MSSRAAARLAWSLGILCAVLLAFSLLLLALNSFATLMTINRPESGFELWVVDAIAAASFPQDGASNAYLLVVNLALAATFTPVGVLIASRRSSNSIGWLFCTAGLLAGVLVFADQYTVYALLTEPGSLPAGAAAAWLASWVWLPPQAVISSLLPLFFPDGRPPTRRWRLVGWLTAVGMAMIVVSLALLPGPFNDGLPSVENPLGVRGISGVLELCFGVGLMTAWACVLASAVSLALRLHRSEDQERQQLKWFAYAATLGALALVTGTLVRGIASFDVVGTVLQFAALPFLPVAVAIAILRHRLFDIDLIINRTLVYGALTASLALVYVGCVVGLQYAFRALTGGGSQLAVVASTLAIAALFNPLRRRVQAFVDRRFYRNKYDAAKALSAFSVKLRDETDLDQLNGDLLVVVRETMRPAHASLWLREPEDTIHDSRLMTHARERSDRYEGGRS
jgi:hypothetical protein